MGYAPLGGGPYSNAARASCGEANGTCKLLGHDVVRKIAAEASRSAAQVLLRWGVQSGHAVVPQSSNSCRIAENSRIFDFSLSPSQMLALADLNCSEFAQKFCW